MNVLFVNRPKNLWIGGDYIQMEKTAEALGKLGVTVEISESPLITPALRMRGFDIVHTFNFSMEWSKYAIWAAKKWDKKTVASMIYHESEEYIPYDKQQVMLDNLDAAIFLTEGEKDRVKRHLTLDDSKAHIVTNGIDKDWFKTMISTVEVERFVLTVGRIEPSKGQLAVAKVCQMMQLPYICIGERHDPSYAFQVEHEGAIIYAPMSQEELIKFYESCSVFVLASRAEVMPLVVMEAGAREKNIVLSNHCEWKVPNAEYVEFNKLSDIEKAIRISLLKPPNIEFKELLKTMTWDDVAKQLKEIYEQTLS